MTRATRRWVGGLAVFGFLWWAWPDRPPSVPVAAPAAQPSTRPKPRIDLGVSSVAPTDVVTVIVPPAPDDLRTRPCFLGFRTNQTFWVAEHLVPSSAASEFALDVAAHRHSPRIPPPVVRDVLSAVGMRPAAWGDWIRPLTPWGAYALLEVDVAWTSSDRRDVLRAATARFERTHGVSPYDLTDPVLREAWDAERVPWAREDPGALSLAEDLLSEEDPALRLLAVAELFDAGVLEPGLARELVYASDTPDVLRAALLQRTCAGPVRPASRAELDRLRAAALGTGDGELAVGLALVGLTDAWNGGRTDEAAGWLDLVTEAEAACRAHGRYGGFTRDPRLAVDWSEVPPELQPDAFRATVEAIAASQAEPTQVTVNCDRVPCGARFTQDGDPRGGPLREQVRAAWPGRAVGIWGSSNGARVEWTDVVAVSDAGWREVELRRMAERRAMDPAGRSCLGEAAYETLTAEVAEPLSREPDTWAGALRSAVFACHREPGTGPIAEAVGSFGRWTAADGWRFVGAEPLLRCVERRVWGPSPPEGREVTLEVRVGSRI